MINQMFFADLCERELRLCRLHNQEVMAVLSYAGTPDDYPDAFMAAATRLGATVLHIRIPRVGGDGRGIPGDGFGRSQTGVTSLAGNRAAVEALKTADLIIDNMGLLFSAEQRELLAAGCRILTCTQPVDHLVQLFPTPEMRRQVEAAIARLAAARELRVTNDAGTDVTYQLGAYPALGQYGYTDTPGRWDHWPSGGFVYTGASDDGVEGRLVLSPGDIVFPLNRYVVEPVELTIERGLITKVQGGADAELMSAFLDSYADPRGYAISHIGWGLEERAAWWGLAADGRGIGMEGRTFKGSVLFSTGPNSELGGPNDTACHQDIPMHNCSLYLDGEPVVAGGRLAGVPAATP
jgi:2,5-dihydroxypyridine 5,6-dioxygenase